MIEIRDERPDDFDAVRAVNDAAFGQPEEGAIVDAIRAAIPEDIVSLVAEEDGEVVGHILFSPATIGEVIGMGLAPMALRPDRQREGIGSRLVEEGLGRLRAAGCPFVIVLGHAPYYPRFGFEPASKLGIRSQWDGIPDDVFMAQVLDAAAMAGVEGVACYRPEFDG